jgi:hypothetical protein
MGETVKAIDPFCAQPIVGATSGGLQHYSAPAQKGQRPSGRCSKTKNHLPFSTSSALSTRDQV